MKLPIALVAFALPLAAQLPWSSLDGLAAKARESVEITLDANSLQMANGLFGAKGKDDPAAKVLSSLKGITVRTYEFASEGQYDANVLRGFREQLLRQGWSKMIDVKEGKESFELYLKTEQGKNAGFAMIAAESKELAIIHIDGPIDLAQLNSIGGQFGIPRLPMGGGNEKGKE
jgi:hypothetical protein